MPMLVILKICEYIITCLLLLPPFTPMGQGGTDQLADLLGISPCCGVQDQSIGKVTSQQPSDRPLPTLPIL